MTASGGKERTMRGLLVAVAVAAGAAGPAARAAPDVVDELFRAAPSPPRDPCGATPAAKEEFRRTVAEFRRRLDRETGQRRRAAKQVRKGDEVRIREEMAAQYPGAAGMDRAKLRKMSKAEKLAMAQQMMAQQGGAIPPGAGVPPAALPAASAGPAASASAEQAQAQKDLADRVSAREQQGRARLEAFLASEADAAAAARQKELAALEAELAKFGDTIESDEEERKAWTPAQRRAWAERGEKRARLERQHRAAADRYCAQLGPGYRDAVGEYRAAIVVGRADYDRLERGQEALAAGGGARLTSLEPGLLALEALGNYADAVGGPDPFRFDVRRDAGDPGR
jgi:hypothetical protein